MKKMEIKDRTKTEIALNMSSFNSMCIDCVPSYKDKDAVLTEAAKEFESFFIREFLNLSFEMSGELGERYGYFYKEIIFDVLSRHISFGLSDFIKKALENQFQVIEKGYIKGTQLHSFWSGHTKNGEPSPHSISNYV